MTFLIADLGAFALATLGAVLLLLLPGFGLRVLLVRGGVLEAEASALWSALLGGALLPAADALLVRWGGMPLAMLVHIALVVIGARSAWRTIPTISWPAWAGAAIWWLLIAWALADFGDTDGVNQSLIVLDMVKHAAVVASISANGLPLVDPFVARDAAAGYYHYFYIGPALIDWAAPLADARGAMMAATWSAGLAFFAMLILVAGQAGLNAGRQRWYAAVLALLMLVSGLDLVPLLVIWLRNGILLGQLDWWAQEVRWGAISLLWVPHHLLALTAAMAACLIVDRPGRFAPSATVAGIALASAFGMSVWVALAMAPAIAGWWLIRTLRGERPALLLAAGAVALVVAGPQLYDLWHGRAPGPFPLAFRLRNFGAGLPTTEWQDAVLLPLSLAIEFGLFAYGSWRWFASRDRGRLDGFALLLAVMTVAGLTLAVLVQSVLINNDFGWRAMWLAQAPTMLWTAAWLSASPGRWRAPALFLLGGLGLAAATVDLIGLRAIRPPAFRTTLEYINAHPGIDAELRRAYHWANRALPHSMLVQHNPASDQRAFAFGLYGRHRPWVADAQAHLFGASEADVAARMAAAAPLFDGSMLLAETRARAARMGIGALVFNSRDPAFPVDRAACAWASRHVCVVETGIER